jgi:hypothetical protein
MPLAAGREVPPRDRPRLVGFAAEMPGGLA